ncbi:MAG: hypothetical protein JWO38_590 [Gemmataceae bacterium]|nr:hypothetical protein [Gemmataceae bacterium]
MPATTRRPSAARLAVVPVVVLAAAVALSAQPPDPKKLPDPPKAVQPPAAPKEQPKATPAVGLRLPDGTFLWTGPGGGGDGERVLLTPQEHQKLLDQIDQLKKQLAARKTLPPSGCAVTGRVEKRGETVVAALRATYTFRTTTPNAAVALGGKRAFLVAAALDGAKLPVLDTGDDGFVVLVEAAGDHTLALDLEAPVTGRGTKTEVGFEVGLPRAAITSLALDPPPGVARVNLTTRTTDPAQPGKPPETRRAAADLKQPAPLGAVDSVEVSWEPPATTPAAAVVQAAEVEVTCLLAEGFVETVAKIRPRGPARAWRFAAPADAVLSVDRAAGAAADPGPGGAPVVTRPADPTRSVWKVDLPAGTAAADWTVTAVVRAPRPKAGDPKHKGPFPVGPFAALDVAHQTGTVRVTTAANTRLVVRHGPDLRQDAPPAPAADDETAAFYRFATGPTGGTPPPAPLLTAEAQLLPGQVSVRPTYRLTLTDTGWRVRAEIRVFPFRTGVDTVTIELPAGWRGPEASPTDVVESVDEKKTDGPRQVYAVRLTAEHKQPFDLVLTATVPVPPAARGSAVLLPRYPNATERDAAVTATVPDALEVRGVGHDWDGDQPAAWGQPLSPVPGPDGKPPKAVTAVTGKFDRGLARVDFAWAPYRPELTADVRAEVTVHDTQLVVTERVKLRSPDGFPKPVKFRGGPDLKALAPFDPLGPGEWAVAPAAEAKDVAFPVEFAVPLPPRPADGGPRRVPVGLLWPAGATRTDALVRVWAASGTGRTIGTDPGPWRELPPEPTPDRDALPALTLAGSGGEAPLVLEIRDAAETGAAPVWVERGLVQALAGDEGTTYRARFLLKRWLTDSVEVRLPGALAGTTPEVFLDDPPRKVTVSPGPAGGPDRVIRVPLPEARPGRTIVLEIRYLLPAGPGDEAEYTPPRPKAAFAGPVRWRVTGPAGSVPLVVGEGRAEQRWRARSGLLVPVGGSADDLERWFQTGTEGDDGAGNVESAVVRMTGPEAVRVYHVPRVGLVVGCSVAVLLAGLVVVRLPGGVAGPVVAALAGAAAVAAVLYPQPAGQAAGAAGPGLAALVLILVAQTAAQWYYRRRVTYLPGFTRTRAEPVAVPPTGGSAPSGAARPSRNGSTGPAESEVPVAPQPVAPSGS